MKRVARWMFDVLVCVSLLGCVAAAGIWGWSYWRTFELKQFEYRGERCRVFVQRGKVGVDNDPRVQDEIREGRRLDQERQAMLDRWVADAKAMQRRSELAEIYRITGLKKGSDLGGTGWGDAAFDLPRLPAALNGMYLSGISTVRPWSRTGALVVPATLCVFAIAPAVTLIRMRKIRGRRRRGECLVCGYDLRASGERCPECGSLVGKNGD